MIDLETPEAKPVRVLAREAMSKTRRGRNFEIVQDHNRADRRLIERKKEGVLALGRVRWTVDEDQMRALQAEERVALPGDIKGLDRPKPIPAAGQGNHFRKIVLAFRNRVRQFFGAAQPVRRILDAGRGSQGATKRMGRTARTKFERRASCGQQSGHFLEKPATGRWQNPGRNLGVGARLRVVLLDETVELRFQRRFSGRLGGFSDNPSELLSPFRYAFAVSARF